MRRVLLVVVLLSLFVVPIVAAWVFAGDRYDEGVDDVVSVQDVGRDDPVVAAAIADANLAVPDEATAFGAQFSEAQDFSAVTFTLPADAMSEFLTASGFPTPFDETPTPAPPVLDIGWDPVDPLALVTVSDTADGRERLLTLDLADPERPVVLVRSTA